MFIFKLLKSNKGSALALVMFMVVIMSLLGVAIMTLTLSDFKMSILYSDQNRAYYAAEAGVEQVARVLDEKVAAVQEQARLAASADVFNLIKDPNNTSYRNADGSLKNISTSLDASTDPLTKIFREYYAQEFITALASDSFFSMLGPAAASSVNLNARKQLIGSTAVQAESCIKDSTNSLMSLDSAAFNPLDNTVSILVSGVFTNTQNNKYTKKISVKFNLLSEASKDVYNIVPQVKLGKPADSPSILTGRAVIAEKNLISAGGTLNINGDVLCFGTIPVDKVNTDAEDQNAQWYMYGGIMAGLAPTAVTGMSINDYNNYFGFDANRTGTAGINGSINISGNAATMSYIHTLFGTSSNNSAISVGGKAFARSVSSEIPAYGSNLQFNTVYTSDNLQVDSNNTHLTVNGAYYGFVDGGYVIDGSGSPPDPNGEYRFKQTSSIVVNGVNSDASESIRLNGTSLGGVYIAGSSFFTTYTDSQNKPYMSGISAIKSNYNTVNAFKEKNVHGNKTRLYYSDGSYIEGTKLYKPDGSVVNVAGISFKDYYFLGVPVLQYNMLNGAVNSTKFDIFDRAAHFKGLWNYAWKDKNPYSAYVNNSSIKIDTSAARLYGYSFGALTANNAVLDSNDFQPGVDSTVFGLLQKGYQSSGGTWIKGWINEFHDVIQDLLSDTYDRNKPRLNYVRPSRSIEYYTAPVNVPSNPYLIDLGSNGFVYFSNDDVNITYDNSSGSWKMDGTAISNPKGIIYSKKNIYVQSGFSFTGIMLSEGNAVFYRGATSPSVTTTITYDQNVIKSLLLDDRAKAVFGMNRKYELPDGAIKGQRISQKNLSIEDWKEN